MKKIGLVLGKYAPLHKGHQYVIETALREMDEVVVMVYDTPVTDVPLQVRANWIRRLYPEAIVMECWDGPDGYGLDPETVRIQNEYILNATADYRITHFYNSEPYGPSVAEALGAMNRPVDPDRKQVPISATMVRQATYEMRHFIPDIVYQDLITKVVFMGAMSTGKSTITEALAKRYNTTFMHEYGRDYWTEHQVDRRIPLESFDEIAVGHIKLEDAQTFKANRYLFVDTNAITTYVFAKDYHGRAPALLTELASKCQTRYDLFFVCEDDIPYDDTWDRSGSQKRAWFHKMVKADLHERKIPYISLFGDLEARIKTVDKVLVKFRKYENPFEAMV